MENRNGHTGHSQQHRQQESRSVHHPHTLGTSSRTNSEEGLPTYRKRPRPDDEPDETLILPSGDRNEWYYPSRPYDSDDDELQAGTPMGNWGRKHLRNARFVRKGKMAAWGPGREEYDIEERARTRLRHILPEFTGQGIPRDPILPHLRSPSPPLVGPYLPAPLHQSSFTASIFDPNISGSFRSPLVGSLEKSASELIQSEIALNRALGRFWAVLTDYDARTQKEERTNDGATNAAVNGGNPNTMPADPHNLGATSMRLNLARVFTQKSTMQLDFTPPGHPPQSVTIAQPHQLDLMTKSVALIRELQEDSRECQERLEEIMDTLGKAKNLRDQVWSVMRARAIEEMEAEREPEE